MAKALKGLARGLTADLVGGPVDLATTLANLGVAAFGFGGHKLGLLDRPPELIDPKTVPFSSDWFAKGTPLEDDGSAQYTAGRLAAATSPMAWAAAGKVKPQPKGQVNALFPGGSDDYLLQHATNDDTAGDFYHLSSALTKKLDSRFGPVIYAMNPAKLEPKTSSSTIKNRDFFSPRHATSWAEGRTSADGLHNMKKFFKGDKARIEEALKESARARLADRFEPQFPLSGMFGENMELGGRNELKQFGPRERPMVLDDPGTPDTLHAQIVKESPRFQSFKHWEKSPAGAGTLDSREQFTKVTPPQLGAALQKKLWPVLDTELVRVRGYPAMNEQDLYESAKILAKSGFEPARLYLQGMRQLPSDYGEVKTWGHLPLNKETVGGAIFPDVGDYSDLRKALKKKGIPFETYTSGASSADPFSLRGAETRQQFLDFQNSVQRRTRD